jgi:hypothetical protein
VIVWRGALAKHTGIIGSRWGGLERGTSLLPIARISRERASGS